MTRQITLNVTKGERYWVGVPDGYPGSCMGRTIQELIEEARAVVPFMAGGQDGAPADDVEIRYSFQDIPEELLAQVDEYKRLVRQRAEIESRITELGKQTSRKLREAANLIDEDIATLLNVSRQRVNQLRNAG